MVTGIMKSSVSKMFDNRADLEGLEDKSDNLRNTASRFRMQSAKLERMTRWRNLKMKLIIAFMIFMFFIIIYYFVL
jgi:hypothetical protein